MIESQGVVQQAVKTADTRFVATLEEETQKIRREMGDGSRTGLMSYRMRIAVK